MFALEAVEGELPPKAVMDSSKICDCCGEPVMASKLQHKDGATVCGSCLLKTSNS